MRFGGYFRASDRGFELVGPIYDGQRAQLLAKVGEFGFRGGFGIAHLVYVKIAGIRADPAV